MKIENAEEHVYFTDMPESLAKSCDTLLLLDDGSKLPVHAAILARSSEVFSGMLDEGPLAAASRDDMVVVPLSECKRMWSTDSSRSYIQQTSRNTSPRPQPGIWPVSVIS